MKSDIIKGALRPVHLTISDIFFQSCLRPKIHFGQKVIFSEVNKTKKNIGDGQMYRL